MATFNEICARTMRQVADDHRKRRNLAFQYARTRALLRKLNATVGPVHGIASALRHDLQTLRAMRRAIVEDRPMPNLLRDYEDLVTCAIEAQEITRSDAQAIVEAHAQILKRCYLAGQTTDECAAVILGA